MINKKECLRIFFNGFFSLLIIKYLISLITFLSKVVSVYILDDIYKAIFFMAFFFIILFIFEMIFLDKYHQVFIRKKCFRSILIIAIFLFFLGVLSTFIEGRYLSIFIAENYTHKEVLFSATISQYATTTITINNILLIIFSIFKLWK